jgi:hypothetical protein
VAAVGARASDLSAALAGASSGSGGSASGSSASSSMRGARLEAAAAGLLCSATALLSAEAALPGAWVLPGALPALAACVPIIRGAGGRGPPTLAALTYVRDFLAADLEYPSPGLAEAVHGAVGEVFECFGGDRSTGAWAVGIGASAAAAEAAGAAAAAGAAGGGAPGSGAARAAAAAAAARAAAAASGSAAGELWEDLLLLLDILQRLCDAETVSFSGGSPSSDTLLKGLSLLLPLLSPALLAFPRVSAAYMTVAAHIVSVHPTHTARLSPPLFAALINSLLAGAGHHEPEVAERALSAVRGLGLFHCGARERGGAYAALDLSAQLASAPALFHTLARAVLGLALGAGGAGGGAGGGNAGGGAKGAGAGAGAGAALHPSLVNPAAEALLACICAEPSAFQGAAEALLGQHAGTHGAATAARLAGALTALTTVHLDTPQGGRAQVALTLKDRRVRAAFEANFQVFVATMAGALTIL